MGWILLFFAQITMCLGINCKWWPSYLGLNFGVMGLWLMMFTAILLFFELRYRKIMSERDPFTKVQTKMTSE